MDFKFVESTIVFDYAVIVGHSAHQRLSPNSRAIDHIVATFTEPRFIYGGIRYSDGSLSSVCYTIIRLPRMDTRWLLRTYDFIILFVKPINIYLYMYIYTIQITFCIPFRFPDSRDDILTHDTLCKYCIR